MSFTSYSGNKSCLALKIFNKKYEDSTYKNFDIFNKSLILS